MASEPSNENAEGVKPKSSMMKIIILVVIVAVLGGGGFFGYKKFFAKPHEEGAVKEVVVQPVIQEMETFLVNLSDPGGKRYLKCTMKMKVSSPDAAAEMTNRIFEVRDMILTILSSKEYEDIARPEDKLALKQELMTTLNRALQKGQIQDIYFTEFLVQ